MTEASILCFIIGSSTPPVAVRKYCDEVLQANYDTKIQLDFRCTCVGIPALWNLEAWRRKAIANYYDLVRTNQVDYGRPTAMFSGTDPYGKAVFALLFLSYNDQEALAESHFKLAQKYQATGEFLQAFGEYAKAIKLHPISLTTASGYFNQLLNMCLEMGINRDEVFSAFKALSLNDFERLIHIKLSRPPIFLEEPNIVDDTLTIKDVFEDEYPRAFALIEEVKTGRGIRGAEYYPVLLKAEDLWLSARDLANDRFRHALALRKAALAYSVLVHIAPNDSLKAAAYGSRGLVFEEMAAIDKNSLNKAIEDEKTAIGLLETCDPDTFERNVRSYYEHLGRLYERTGDVRAAIKAYREIRKRRPNYLVAEKRTTVDQIIEELERNANT